MIDDIDLSYHDVLFNGTFGNDSIFRHDPSPEVDYAWRYISTGVGVARMSKEDFEHAGISLDMARLPEEYYGGGYMGFIEVFHQLHCVVSSLSPIQLGSHVDLNKLPGLPPQSDLVQLRLLQGLWTGVY